MNGMMLDGDDDDVTHGKDVGPEESTTEIEWAVINPQTELSCSRVQKRHQSTSKNLHTT